MISAVCGGVLSQCSLDVVTLYVSRSLRFCLCLYLCLSLFLCLSLSHCRSLYLFPSLFLSLYRDPYPSIYISRHLCTVTPTRLSISSGICLVPVSLPISEDGSVCL